MALLILNFLKISWQNFIAIGLSYGYINPNCTLLCAVNCLGYEIGQNSYIRDSIRTSVVQYYPTSKNPRDIKRFVGLCNYFKRTIKNYCKSRTFAQIIVQGFKI